MYFGFVSKCSMYPLPPPFLFFVKTSSVFVLVSQSPPMEDASHHYYYYYDEYTKVLPSFFVDSLSQYLSSCIQNMPIYHHHIIRRYSIILSSRSYPKAAPPKCAAKSILPKLPSKPVASNNAQITHLHRHISIILRTK